MQKSMLFPGHSTQGRPQADLPRNINGEIVRLTTAQKDEIVAWFAPAKTSDAQPLPNATDRPTILFFYGNGMCLAYAVGLLDAWQRLGANTAGVEYPGYGLSGGEPGEAAFYAAADAAYDELIRRGVRPTQIIAAGLSLGTGVAVDLAARKTVGGVALFTAFTNMDALAKKLVPWLPTTLILQHHFRSDAKIGTLAVPLLIVHGTRDTMIPISMARELASKATRATVDWVEVPAGHNDLFLEAQPQIEAATLRLLGMVQKAE